MTDFVLRGHTHTVYTGIYEIYVKFMENVKSSCYCAITVYHESRAFT